LLSYKEQKQGSSPCGSQGSGLKQKKLVFDLRCDNLAQEKQKLVFGSLRIARSSDGYNVSKS